MDRRVVITGLGVLSPNGIGKESFWDALCEGKSGIKKILSFDTSCYTNPLGGEITDFEPNEYLEDDEVEAFDRVCQLFIASTALSLEDAQLDVNSWNKRRIGVIAGTTTAADRSNYHTRWALKGYDKVTNRDIFRYRTETIANCITMTYNIKGTSVTIGNACAAGTYAIGQSYQLIRAGKADIMLAGGTESMSETAVCGFGNTRSIAKTLCRPFDKNRDGLLVGEGAATLVLESYDNAKRRGAHIYGEVVGYGLSCDANHMTAPDTSGEAAALCMGAALADSGLKPNDIDYINAHGTGTPLNDKMETNAAKIVFGKRAYAIPMSSIKAMIGHTFGAAGAIEAVASSLVLERGIVPPTTNYEEPDPECDLDYVPNKSRKSEVKAVMSNSYAFGGNNASIIIQKV